MAVAIAATEQDAYPPRILVSLTGLTVDDAVMLYRVVAGTRTLVRGGQSDGVTDPSLLTVDAEFPFGVPVTYTAVVNGLTEYTSSPLTVDLVSGLVLLSDAITSSSADVAIGADGGETRTRNATRYRVGGRNLVVSGPLPDPEGSYTLLTLTTSQYEQLLVLLRTATQGTLQVRQPGTLGTTGEPYDGVDGYLAVDKVTTGRFSQDGSDPRRLVTIEFARVTGWAEALLARGFTYQDVADFYATGDYADAAADSATYLIAAQTDWSA